MNIDQEIAILVNLLQRVEPIDSLLEYQLELLLKAVTLSKSDSLRNDLNENPTI